MLLMGLGWALACTGLFFWVLGRQPARLPKLPMGWVAALALVLRIVPALILRQGTAYEMYIFRETGRELLAGKYVLGRMPYLPAFIYWMAGSDWLARTVGLDYTFWIKFPSILADVLLIGVLARYCDRHGSSLERRNQVLLLYALNPVTLLVSGYHGQFDTIPTLFLFLSLALLTPDSSQRESLLAGLSLGLGILAKTWPGILVLCVLVSERIRARAKLVFVGGAGAVPLAGLVISVIAYGGGFPELLSLTKRALQAGAIPGWWGYTGLWNGIRWIAGAPAADFSVLLSLKLPIVLLPTILVVWLMRRGSLITAVFWPLVTLFIFAPGLGLQSLSWLVVVILLGHGDRLLGWYIGLSVFHMLVSYWGIHFTPNLYALLPTDAVSGFVQLSAVPVWIFLIFLWVRQVLGQGPGQDPARSVDLSHD